jgi:flagellar hook-associated protein FlgK
VLGGYTGPRTFCLALSMSLSTLNNALSGLQAATAKMQVTANNVANARTDGYQTQRVDVLERPGGAEVTTSADTTATGSPRPAAP